MTTALAWAEPLADSDPIERRLRQLIDARATFAPVRAIVLAKSRRIRAGLVQVCSRAVELPERAAHEIATAVELLHTFTLVHDDVADGATLRRGCPTVHEVDGTPVAINVGDALHALVWSVIADVDAPARRTLELAQLLGASLGRMAAGRARALAEHRTDALHVDQYLETVRDRAGALGGFSAAAPAVLAGHGGAAHLFAFGEELGIVMHLLGDPQARVRFGREPVLALADEHLESACDELAHAGLTRPLEVRLFAQTMHACLAGEVQP